MQITSPPLAFILASFWGLVLLCSLVGWGGAVNRLLVPERRCDWGLRAGWGIAWTIAVGGLLNLLWLISPAVVIAYVAAGVALFAGGARQGWRGLNFKSLTPTAAVFVAAALLLLFQYASQFHKTDYNVHDDYLGYINLPVKMIRTGSMGRDPFSEVRLLTSLGGQYFLDTLVLAVLPLENILLLDLSVGLVLWAGLLAGWGRERKVPGVAIAGVIIFLMLGTAHEFTRIRANTTGFIIPLALFLTLFRTLELPGMAAGRTLANALLLGLITAALCTIKTNLLPPLGIMLGVSYLFVFLKARAIRRPLGEAALTGALTLIFMLPWMISLYQSSGTPWFPVFGQGYYATRYGVKLDPLGLNPTEFPFQAGLQMMLTPHCLALLALAATGLYYRPWRLTPRAPLLALTLAAGVGSIVTTQLTAGTGNMRYIFPILYAAIPILLLLPFARPGGEAGKKRNGSPSAANGGLARGLAAAVAIATPCVLLYLEAPDSAATYRTLGENLSRAITVNPAMVTPREREAYGGMQASVPAGEKILVRVEKPFLLDFRRNPVFIESNTWGTSPPPGLPRFQGPEAVAQYLRGQGIRYVAYSYATECAHSLNDPEIRARLNLDTAPLIQVQTEITYDFQRNLSGLGAKYKRIFDDGDKFMLDLQAQ